MWVVVQRQVPLANQLQLLHHDHGPSAVGSLPRGNLAKRRTKMVAKGHGDSFQYRSKCSILCDTPPCGKGRLGKRRPRNSGAAGLNSHIPSLRASVFSGVFKLTADRSSMLGIELQAVDHAVKTGFDVRTTLTSSRQG